MSKTEEITEVKYIRIPKKFANMIRKIKAEGDFQSWSGALLYHIQERRDSQIQLELLDIKVDLSDMKKAINQLAVAQLAANEHQDKTSEAFKVVGFNLGRLATQIEKHEKAD